MVNPPSTDTIANARLTALAAFEGPISVFHSAATTFYAPLDVSGIHGMRHEWIRATPCWRHKEHCYDCVFMVVDQERCGMRGMIVGCARLFFSFVYHDKIYPCVLLNCFSHIGHSPNPVTGLWKVRPDLDRHGRRVQSVEHLDVIYRAAHLIPVYGDGNLPPDFHFSYSLDVFDSYYVNKYADHHANEIAF